MAGNQQSPGENLGLPAELYEALDTLLADAPFGFAVFDPDLRFVHGNAVMAQLVARTPGDLVGTTLHQAGGDVGELLSGHLLRTLSTGHHVLDVELSLPSAGIQRRRYLASFYPVQLVGQATGVAAVLSDVTTSHAATAELQAQARQQAAVVDLGLRALSGTTTRELIGDAARVVTEILGVDQSVVFKRLDEEDALILRAADPPQPDLLDELTITAGDGTQAGFTLTHDGPVIVVDIEREARFTAIVATGGKPVRSSVTMVVPGPLRPYGVLGAYSTALRDFAADEIRFLQAVANVIGTAAERRRAEEAVLRTARRLELAEDAGRMGVWEYNLRTGELLWSDAMKRLFGLAAADFSGSFDQFMSHVHPEDRVLVQERVAEALERGGYEVEYRILRRDGQLRWTVARGEPMRDVAGTVTGMIGINLDITERKAAEQERLELLAREQAARADAEQARERLSFLASATNALAGSLDESTTLETLTRLAVPIFADACLVDLMNDEAELLNVASKHRDPHKQLVLRRLREEVPGPRPAVDPRVAIARGGASQLLTEISDAMIEGLAKSEAHLDLMQQARGASAILVPLPARGRVVGVLTFLRDATRDTFAPDDVGLAEELGRRAALAIDNARLYEETRRTGQRFRRMAETLQASLLPPLLPTIEGLDLAAKYLPAAEGVGVGGDFYDVFQMSEHRWGVVIGDVQGKGTEAATLTGLARHTVRTAAIGQGPARTLETLNEVIVRDAASEEDGGRFCTILHGRLEPHAGGATLELASGGHPPAMVRRADGTVERVGGGGSLMGLFRDITLHREAVEMHRGDAIVLYTDGVIEARRGAAEFGDSGLAEVLADTDAADAATLATAVQDAVVSFSEGRMRDDVALLVIRVRAA